jgi:hypothetical protein
MARYAIVRQGIVRNVVDWDGDTERWSPPADTEAVLATGNVAPGWFYADGTFTEPAPEIIDWEAVDIAALNAVLAQPGSVVRGLALVMLDELNQHAAQLNALRDVMVNASSLATVRSAASAIPAYPTRTVDQLKSAIQAKMR